MQRASLNGGAVARERDRKAAVARQAAARFKRTAAGFELRKHRDIFDIEPGDRSEAQLDAVVALCVGVLESLFFARYPVGAVQVELVEFSLYVW
jgi:hypothetical protein